MLEQQLLIIGGKGGVGRTTVAAALGTALARSGRRTLLAHVRCKQRLSTVLGCPQEIGHDISAVEPNLWAVNMDPQAAIREMGLLTLKFRTVYRMVLENRMVRSFLRAVPALEEYSMVGKAWFHTTETLSDGQPRFETVIFDGPATGHLVSMLQIPQIILESVPDGPLTSDARKAQALLADPARACLWVVTLAEEMAVSEALDLYRQATDSLHIAVNRIVVNGLYPADLVRRTETQELLGNLEKETLSSELSAMVTSTGVLAARRRVNDLYLDRLEARLPVPRIELPHFFVPELGPSEISEMAARMRATLMEHIQ